MYSSGFSPPGQVKEETNWRRGCKVYCNCKCPKRFEILNVIGKLLLFKGNNNISIIIQRLSLAEEVRRKC